MKKDILEMSKIFKETASKSEIKKEAWVNLAIMGGYFAFQLLSAWTHSHVTDIESVKGKLNGILDVINAQKEEGFGNPQLQKIFENYESNVKTVLGSITDVAKISENQSQQSLTEEQAKSIEGFVKSAQYLLGQQKTILDILGTKQDASSYIGGFFSFIGKDLNRYRYFQSMITQIATELSILISTLKAVQEEVKENSAKQNQKEEPKQDSFGLSKIDL